MRLKKIITVAAALAMAMSMSLVASFAADIDNGVKNTTDTQISIPKGVTFINEDAVSSYGPDITYTYSVAPAGITDGQYTVKDAAGHITSVNNGVADGLSFHNDVNSITFANSQLFTTSASGVETQKDIVLDVDLSKFSKPGVYRYKITDTTALADLYAAGITRDDNYQEDRYIDVFIHRNATSGALEISGYALKTTNDSTDGTATPPTAKDPGYVVASDVEDGTPADTDRYETYNVSVTKQVAGAMGDREHGFPFDITVTNQGKLFQSAYGDVNAAKAATAATTTALHPQNGLKHGQTYTLVGLSPKATLAVVETNDTTDLYTVTVAGSTGSIQVTENASAKTYSIAASAVSTYDADNSATTVNDLGAKTNYSAVTYTNTLDDVSPTGLVLRFGIYFFAIAAALMLFAVSRTSSDEKEDGTIA